MTTNKRPDSLPDTIALDPTSTLRVLNMSGRQTALNPMPARTRARKDETMLSIHLTNTMLLATLLAGPFIVNAVLCVRLSLRGVR